MKKRHVQVFIALFFVLVFLVPFASAKGFVWTINGVNVTSAVVLLDAEKDLGAITSFVQPDATSVQVSAQTQDVLLWLGTINDRGQQSATSLSGDVWACLDTDHNGQCDIDQASGCLSNSGDWYKGFCCGVDYKCGYVASRTVLSTVYVKNSENDIVTMTNAEPTTSWFGALIWGKNGGYVPITTATLYTQQVSDHVNVRTTPAYGYTAISAPVVYVQEDKNWYGQPFITSITTTPPSGKFFTNPPKPVTLYEVRALNAYCGNTSEGAWEWAPADEGGQIHALDGCPGMSVVADGTALYQCGGNQTAEGIQPFGNVFRNVSIGSTGSYVLVEEQLNNWPKNSIYCRLYNYGLYQSDGTYGTDMATGSIAPAGSTTTVIESAPNGLPVTVTKAIADGVLQYAWGASGCYPDGSYTCTGSNTNDYCTSYHAKVWRPLQPAGTRHSFSCINGTLLECGGNAAFSTSAAPVGSRLPGTQQTYYCASDGDWTTDLDTKDAQSCTAAGFSWTGKYCCGEADDGDEYYNDPSYPNGTGGCWKKAFIASGDFKVPGRVLNYKGQFFGCRITDNSLLALKDTHTTDWLVNNSMTPCGAVLPNAQPGGKPHAICQPDGLWKFTDELGGTLNKSIAWSGLVSLAGIEPSGCCAYDQCWDGRRCQPLGAFYRVGEYGFVCKI